jgi:hypothetical protein
MDKAPDDVSNIHNRFSLTLINPSRQFGPMVEIAPDAGIFESDITIKWTDGPASTICPDAYSYTGLNGTSRGSELVRFDAASSTGAYCILQGDILQVEYTDATDASGDSNTVTDSAARPIRVRVQSSSGVVGPALEFSKAP